MTAFFFKGIPEYRLSGFCAVRDSFDNLSNVMHLAELVNTCANCMAGAGENDFDFAIFSGAFCRALIRRGDGYFSMAIPFHIIEAAHGISFNYDAIGEEVDGRFISIIRNALLTSRDGAFSHDDIVCSLADAFGLTVADAILYYDAFVMLLADDHGYFRFDDDQKNENGVIHPRYHFDFFYKNSTSIKIGLDTAVDISCFYALFDGGRPKRYLR